VSHKLACVGGAHAWEVRLYNSGLKSFREFLLKKPVTHKGYAKLSSKYYGDKRIGI
jgi:hypothetical protein